MQAAGGVVSFPHLFEPEPEPAPKVSDPGRAPRNHWPVWAREARYAGWCRAVALRYEPLDGPFNYHGEWLRRAREASDLARRLYAVRAPEPAPACCGAPLVWVGPVALHVGKACPAAAHIRVGPVWCDNIEAVMAALLPHLRGA